MTDDGGFESVVVVVGGWWWRGLLILHTFYVFLLLLRVCQDFLLLLLTSIMNTPAHGVDVLELNQMILFHDRSPKHHLALLKVLFDRRRKDYGMTCNDIFQG